MVAGSDPAFSQATELADRLRDLRKEHKLTQQQLADILSASKPVGVTTISSWENASSNQPPPLKRLEVYARLFCTNRPFASGSPRLLRDDELTEEEGQKEAELFTELRALRERVQSLDSVPATNKQPSLVWHFKDENRINIFCSGVEQEERPRYADPSHLNYTPYASFADLNALVDVYGEVRAENPSSEVNILLPEKLDNKTVLSHLVFIGGAAVAKAEADQDKNAAGQDVKRFVPNIPLPTAEAIPGTNTHRFICNVDGEARGFASSRERGALIEDIGLIARGPHPNIPDRTVTMLSGITSRGVHGAALCFIDPILRESNEIFLKSAFGNTKAFCILMRVPVEDNVAMPPNLSDNTNRLYEWSAETGAHWGQL